LQDLLDDGHAEAVVALAEHAIDRAEDAVGYVDDSDGWMSGIAERLQDLHQAACAAAQPDPVTLARTLFDRERHSGDLEVFYGAASAYAEVLGAEGLAEYRRLAQVEWDALPPLGPKEEERSWSSRRFRITQIMQTLAELTGDVDAAVEVLARDQSSAYQFVRIAEVLRGEGIAARLEYQLLAVPEPGAVVVTCGALDAGFSLPPASVVVLTESDVFGTRTATKDPAPQPRFGSSGGCAFDASGHREQRWYGCRD